MTGFTYAPFMTVFPALENIKIDPSGLMDITGISSGFSIIRSAHKDNPAPRAAPFKGDVKYISLTLTFAYPDIPGAQHIQLQLQKSLHALCPPEE